jgi:hypothetical protein
MPWSIVERRIGRAGGIKQRLARQRQWDRKYGDGMWMVGYHHEGEFITQEEAYETIYCASYEAHFRQHPDDLDELLTTAKTLRNPHAEATTGVDLQVPAIMAYLRAHEHTLRGQELVDIGSWQGDASHALSIRLSPLHIKCVGHEKMTLEKFWQSKKCLAIWEDER